MIDLIDHILIVEPYCPICKQYFIHKTFNRRTCYCCFYCEFVNKDIKYLLYPIGDFYVTLNGLNPAYQYSMITNKFESTIVDIPHFILPKSLEYKDLKLLCDKLLNLSIYS